MFTRLSEKLSDQFENEGIISKEEHDLYCYGLNQGLTLLLNVLTVFVIGWMMGLLFQSFVFVAAYSVLRMFAGGFHASTPLRCYLLYICMVTVLLLVIKFLTPSCFICSNLQLVGGIVIWFLAPVEDKNKPLDSLEMSVYRKRTHAIYCIQLSVFVVSLLLNARLIFTPLAFSCFTISVLVLVGKIKNNIYNSRNR